MGFPSSQYDRPYVFPTSAPFAHVSPHVWAVVDRLFPPGRKEFEERAGEMGEMGLCSRCGLTATAWVRGLCECCHEAELDAYAELPVSAEDFGDGEVDRCF